MTSPSLPSKVEELLTSLEETLDEKAELVAKHAGLWARYGPGGTSEKLAAVTLETLKMRLRKKYADVGTKVTESRLEEEVKSSKPWAELVDNTTSGREDYLREKAHIDRITDRSRLLTARLRLLGLAFVAGAGNAGYEDGHESE